MRAKIMKEKKSYFHLNRKIRGFENAVKTIELVILVPVFLSVYFFLYSIFQQKSYIQQKNHVQRG